MSKFFDDQDPGPIEVVAEQGEDDIEPSDEERQPALPEFYRLFWANALPIEGQEDDNGNQMKFSGWCANEHPILDPILAERGVSYLPLFHQMSNKVVWHYAFKALKVIPVVAGGLPSDGVDGFPGVRTLDNNPNIKWYGSAAGWRPTTKVVDGVRVASGKNETFLSVPVLIPSLIDVYPEPVLLTVRSTVTTNLAAILTGHIQACVRAKKLLGPEVKVPAYGVYLILGIGSPEQKGKTLTATIPVPAACINKKLDRGKSERLPTLPDINDDDAVLDWYRNAQVPEDQRAVARSHVRRMMEWSRDYSIRAIRGQLGQGE